MCVVYLKGRSRNSDVTERCGLKEDLVTRVEEEKEETKPYEKMNSSRLKKKIIEQICAVDESARGVLEHLMQTNVDIYSESESLIISYKPMGSREHGDRRYAGDVYMHALEHFDVVTEGATKLHRIRVLNCLFKHSFTAAIFERGIVHLLFIDQCITGTDRVNFSRCDRRLKAVRKSNEGFSRSPPVVESERTLRLRRHDESKPRDIIVN
ncbi:hypothetical protein EVAR_9543_1 [Eumeta japonica]|uniref:Uncharacterized protein n=1 Tax=Eumeta variegata TaxID=151549 RepID=A0A4C1U3S3_EUMVA|nr:hypothetical protein EVAR_9543_1 [Eumeta japonica]